jgi:hypothetical protein
MCCPLACPFTHSKFNRGEKKDAVGRFGGIGWQTLLSSLESKEWASLSNILEEWSVLEPHAARYYLRAFLLYLLKTVQEATPDDEFVSRLFFELSECLKRHGTRLFDARQRTLLASICGFVLMAI